MTGGAPQPPSFAPEVHKGDIPKEYRLQRYYTAADIAGHNTAHNCWVSFFGRVYDLTPLLAEYKGPLAQPIIAAAGSDISFWFDEATGQPKMHLDPVTGMQEIYCPWGRYIHVPPQGPESDWATDFGTPWWEDTAILDWPALSCHSKDWHCESHDKTKEYLGGASGGDGGRDSTTIPGAQCPCRKLYLEKAWQAIEHGQDTGRERNGG